jgi:NAD(P)-dependent dehydrogenase (short-subunit alcohol dehydrogenase family)
MESPIDLQLTNKKALVSGSTAGIGFAIASLLAQEGASVVVSGRSPQRVEEAVQRIRKDRKDAQVTGKPADLGTREGVNLLIRDLPAVDMVNSVLPGPTRFEGVERFVQDMAKGQGTDEAKVEAEFFRTVRPSSLLKRFATPEEGAAMVVYVCSPRASATNGSALRVDGGVIRSIV